MTSIQHKEGMYCSKQFAHWMIKKNSLDTDFPAATYYKLIRLFSRPNYDEFFVEEERKGNRFFYNIKVMENSIRLERSYDLVFLPYEAIIQEDIEASSTEGGPETVNDFIFGYRILQTRGYMPGSVERAFDYHNYYSIDYLIDEIILRAEYWEKKFKNSEDINIDDILEQGKGHDLGYNPRAFHVKCDDIYRIHEFQDAEKKGFIDNEWPYSFGPECPDRIICLQMYTRVINHLMKEVDRLSFAGDNNDNLYEIKVASYVASILDSVKGDYDLSQEIPTKRLKGKAEDLFREYCSRKEQNLDEICRKIRIGLLWDANIIIDRTSALNDDYDYYDTEEAPIGLTADDMDSFNRLSRAGESDSDNDPVDEEDWDDDYLIDDLEESDE